MTIDRSLDVGISILYVEDECDSRNILCEVLALRYPDMAIIHAADGQEGLAAFREHRPEIVITDINLPVTDGIRMAAEIRAISPATEIIALTAHSNTKHMMRAIEIGISHYILKPLDFEHIFKVVEKASEKIRLKKRLARQNLVIRKLSLAMDQSPFVVMLTDPDGVVEYVNPQFKLKTGYESTEVVGRPLLDQESATLSPEVAADLARVIRNGDQWQQELANYKKNGESYWESISVSPIHDEEGGVTNFLVTREDITTRVLNRQQIEELNANLLMKAHELDGANKELEAFNYTVAHDLRAPMVTIGCYSQLLVNLHAAGLDEKGRDYLGVINKEILRMNSLIEALLKFSSDSRKSISKKWTDLSAIVREVADDLALRDPGRQVEFRLAEGIMGYGDPVLLRVVLENLLGNAWKFSESQARAVVEFGTTDSEEELVYFVRDNGIGFAPEEAPKLFVPFQRLQSDVQGFGIGLATAGRIVRRHGGRIWADGEAGKGAAFYFSL